MQTVALEVLNNLARKEFEIELPVDLKDFKSTYLTKVKELHPDREGGDEKRFKDMQTAYELILSFSNDPRVFTNVNNIKEAHTVEGIPLSELGKGITDPLVNGADCHYCEGKGYRSRIDSQIFRAVCPRCLGAGEEIVRKIPCRYCDGSGNYILRRNGKKVCCRACRGTGIHHHIKKRCSLCDGSGVSLKEKEIGTLHNVCFNCDGKGQIPIWNPVLAKNRVHMRKEKK